MEAAMDSDRTGLSRQLGELRRQLYARDVDRRTFIRRAAALGVAMPAAIAMARVYGANAAPATRSVSRALMQDQPENPITITIGGTPIAVIDDSANATPGGTLRFARASDSDNLDPVTNDGNVNIWIFMNVYDQLLKVSLDGAQLEPGLAESWEVSDDGITYTFHLRQGVLFSDGTPFKASDVKYSLERAANDPAQTWTFTLTALKRGASSDPNVPGPVEGITAPDDNTIVIELAQPWAPFLSDLAMFNCSILSEAFSSGKEDNLTQQMMGTGPFMQQEWSKGESITLVKNPNYWETGLPFLDQIVVSVVPEDNTRILQLQGGEVDGIYDVPSSRLDELKSDSNLKVILFPSTFTSYVTLNTREAPLNDVNARLALAYATDRQTLIDVVLFGAGAIATTLMPRGALYWNSELPGFPLEFTFQAGDAEVEQLATVLKDMWSQIGVDVTINPVEQGVYTDSYRSHTFQAMYNSWTNDIIDPDELIAYAILPESSEAFETGWQNAEATELAKQGAAETDPAKRQTIYYRIQEIWNSEAPMVPLYHKPYIDVTTVQVHNFGHPPTGQWVWKKTWMEQ
jgi:peptide/nickel transport system substrate-binding protein